MAGRFVAFGEVMLRLSPPGRELIGQSPRFDVWTAGAEANVAVALAHLGHQTAMVTALPPTALGDTALTTLRGHGVDCSGVLRLPGRMGLYFVVTGSGVRPSRVIYDRAGSAFAEASSEKWEWDRLLAGADRLHLSGITPALGPGGTAAALAAARAATRLGVPLSFDGNYRSQLWGAWDGRPAATLADLVGQADILFGDERDVEMVLGSRFAVDGVQRRRAAADAAFDTFPKLRTVASLERKVDTSDRHRLRAHVFSREETHATEEITVAGIVDRVGTGDAFAAGVLHGMRTGVGLGSSAELGLRLAAWKYSVPGDMAPSTAGDLEAAPGRGLDIAR